MTRLENWYVSSRTTSPYHSPEQGYDCLCGTVYQHLRIADGERVSTTKLLKLDTKTRRAKTANTEYELGLPDQNWLDYLAKNQYNIEDYDMEEK